MKAGSTRTTTANTTHTTEATQRTPSSQWLNSPRATPAATTASRRNQATRERCTTGPNRETMQRVESPSLRSR